MIIFDQPFEIADRIMIEIAALTVGETLSNFTKLEPEESFNAVFGDVHMRYTNTLATWAHASFGVIRFRPGYVILPLVIHELGHLFCVRAKLRPYRELAVSRLDPRAGMLLPGMHPPSLAGYNAVEAWANLFESYCQNAAGRALAAWMDAHMGEWCAIARAG